jgi:hypothetical protein
VSEEPDDHTLVRTHLRVHFTLRLSQGEEARVQEAAQLEAEEEGMVDYNPVEWREGAATRVLELADQWGRDTGREVKLSQEAIEEEINAKWQEWPWSHDWEWGGLQVDGMDRLNDTRKYSIF